MEQILEVELTSISTRERTNLETWDLREAAEQARTLLEIELIEPGTLVPYHEGHLAFDKAKDPDIAGIAAAFYEAAIDRGLGVLTQKRIDQERCQYLFRRAQPCRQDHLHQVDVANGRMPLNVLDKH